MAPLPQFPLGSVLLPTMVLPLHVFEPRYRALVDDVLGGDGEFGVVMIERGSEVGGDDVRTDVGTVARVLESEILPDGRSAIISVGTSRFRVNAWLPDDPYPLADIDLWPDEEATTVTRADLDDTVAALEKCIDLAGTAGLDMGRLPVLSDELSVATMQVATMTPVGGFDKQRILEAPGPDQRVPMLNEAIDGAIELLQFRLGEQ